MSGRLHRQSNLRRFIPIIAGAAMLVAAPPGKAQQRNTLRKIEILGLQRLSSDQVVSASGLKVGDSIDASMVDAAADKLMRSGWFQSVNYRVRSADSDTTVVFELVEKVAATSTSTAETLGQVVWSGNGILSSEELSQAFGLRAGEPAPKPQIDESLDRVRKAYAHLGYVNAQIEVTRNPDGRRTNYQFTIREGPQFRMGTLTLTGLNGADTRSLRGRWTLAPGAVFDDWYLDEYRTTVIRPFVTSRTQRTGLRSKFDVNTKPDPQKQTVDVIITFK